MESTKIALFQGKRIRKTLYQNEWWFSILDIISVLTDSPQPKTYWAKMKDRDREMSQPFPFWEQLKLTAEDGKMRETDCANTEGIFRLIQSIPSPKAEPFKRWLAKVGYERVQEVENPELAMDRMKELYEKKGYPKSWIDKRLRGMAVRQDLTDEWQQRGAKGHTEYAILTNEIMRGTFDMDVQDYKNLKGLQRENLRDHMNDIELILTMLGEATTTKLHRDRDSQGMPKLHKDAVDGGAVAGRTRKDIEHQSSKPVSTKENFLYLEKNKTKKISPRKKKSL